MMTVLQEAISYETKGKYSALSGAEWEAVHRCVKAKSSCSKCYGRGIAGMNITRNLPQVCHCMVKVAIKFIESGELRNEMRRSENAAKLASDSAVGNNVRNEAKDQTADSGVHV